MTTASKTVETMTAAQLTGLISDVDLEIAQNLQRIEELKTERAGYIRRQYRPD